MQDGDTGFGESGGGGVEVEAMRAADGVGGVEVAEGVVPGEFSIGAGNDVEVHVFRSWRGRGHGGRGGGVGMMSGLTKSSNFGRCQRDRI